MTQRPKKKLPAWFEPLCIAGFCVMAVVEWNTGDTFWAYLFAISAFVFSITAFWKKRA